jgi:hypothetical protein
VEEKDIQSFLEDFKKADINKKLDMWYYALDQEAFWEEVISDMAEIANPLKPMQKTVENK